MGIFDKLKDIVNKDLKSITDEGLKGNVGKAYKNYIKTAVKYETR